MSDITSSAASVSNGGLFSLTQIRHLMRVEFGRAQRYGFAITCMMIEIDRLGYLRDLYGYDLKESVLEDVIKTLQNQTRGCDYLGRQVDDRLMAIMPHTSKAGAQAAAERLISATKTLSFKVDGRSLQVTLTIGCAICEGSSTMFFDQLVESSEAALGEASLAGGDRILIHDSGAVEL
ncbi:MAG: two-component system cell cycle response regulator [Planctomycetota bacterium]|jgi:two-component system cell cycle response regulator